VYTVYRTLSLLLAAAVDDRKIAVSPCVRIKLPSRPTVEAEPPPPGELAELVASAPDRVRGSGGPLAGTGLRISEALRLQVGDVNFLPLARRLRVRGAKHLEHPVYAASALIGGGASVKRVRMTTTAQGRSWTPLLRTGCGLGRWSDDISAGQRLTMPPTRCSC
jgi:integrase